MEEEIVERTEILERQNDSKTWKGHIFTPLGYILSIFCAYKIITASLNVVLHRKKTIDPVSRIIGIILTFFSPAFGEDGGIDVEMWSQTISFVFVGVLMTVSVRGFLLKTSFLVRKLSSESSNNMALFIGQVFFSFFLFFLFLFFLSFFFFFSFFFFLFPFSFPSVLLTISPLPSGGRLLLHLFHPPHENEPPSPIPHDYHRSGWRY